MKKWDCRQQRMRRFGRHTDPSVQLYSVCHFCLILTLLSVLTTAVTACHSYLPLLLRLLQHFRHRHPLVHGCNIQC